MPKNKAKGGKNRCRGIHENEFEKKKKEKKNWSLKRMNKGMLRTSKYWEIDD